jgi:hypothetical protein
VKKENSMQKISKAKQQELDQLLMIKKYRLGYNDRTILVMGGLAGSTGVFPRKRYENALSKLISLGLIKKVTAKYDSFDYLLTEEGQKVYSKIYSNC